MRFLCYFTHGGVPPGRSREILHKVVQKSSESTRPELHRAAGRFQQYEAGRASRGGRAATPISQIYVGMTSPQRRIDRESPGAKETRARGQGNAGRGGRRDVFSIVRHCPFQSARVLPKIWKINRRRIPGVWHHLVGCVSPHPARRLIIFSPRCVVRHVILVLSILPLGLLIPAWLTPYAP